MNGETERQKPLFEDEETAVNCIIEGFLGWDTYEILEILCKLIQFVADENMFNEDKIQKSAKELLKAIEEGKRNRIRVANEVRTLWMTGEYTQEQLAILFDLPEDSICSIVTNKTLYDGEYQVWIDSGYVESKAFCDEDGKWRMKKDKKE